MVLARTMRRGLAALGVAGGLCAAPAVAAEVALAFMAFDRGDYAAAFRQFRALAERGDPYSQYNLAVFFADESLGVPRDYRQSVKWYRRAAMQGHAEAQFKLALMYIYGYGVEENRARARRWLRAAAEQGHLDAQYNLGFIYRTGHDVPRDDAEAAKWYRLAAEQGSAGAQAVLGVMYARGEGVARNLVAAERWLVKAAAQGHAQAALDLAYLRESEAEQLAAARPVRRPADVPARP